MKAGDEAQDAHGGVDEVVQRLGQRFASFRELRGPRTRVPPELRRAVLDALAGGVSMRALRRELCITQKQVRNWQREISTAAKQERGSDLPSARVFEVTDRGKVEDSGGSVGAGAALELRLVAGHSGDGQVVELMLPVTIRRVFLAQHRIDFRKQFNGLLAACYQLGADPYRGDCVVFVKKDRTQLRTLVGDSVGLYLISRRFEGGALRTVLRFAEAPSATTLTTAELSLLLEGASFTVQRRARACRSGV